MNISSIVHISVLPRECAEYLNCKSPQGLLIDGTLGEGGHAEYFLRRFPGIRVIGIDADAGILEAAVQRLSDFGSRFTAIQGWADEVLKDYPEDWEAPQAVLFDLGISMYHFKQSGRGFSFHAEEPLDMRINPSGAGKSAADVINKASVEELRRILREYGEERMDGRIVRAIDFARRKAPIRTAKQLEEIIYSAVPVAYRHGRIHPATRTFQALRIHVNQELSRLPGMLESAFSCLAPKGRLGVISFHSLEDRIVKQTFRTWSTPCTCPPELPICKCGGVSRGILLTKKPVVPSDEEASKNPAARSAKFRAIEKRELKE